MDKNNIPVYSIDDSKSYFRRYTSTDIVFIGLMVLFGLTVFGLLISLLIALVYPRIPRTICISEYHKSDQKIWVSKDVWDLYRETHDVSAFNEYREMKRSIPQKHMQLGSADELAGYKKLLDSGVITQEEYDAKKKSILNS